MRILLAGAQNSSHFKDLMHVAQYTDKPLNLLMSFYYIRKMPEKTLEKVFQKMQDNNVWCMLDSGAHTFFSEHEMSIWHRKGYGNKSKKGKTEPEQYLEEYLAWLDKYHEMFQVVVELDIDDIVGHQTIVEWRQRFQDIGVKAAPVVHNAIYKEYAKELDNPEQAETALFKEQSMVRHAKELFKDHSYIGIQGGLHKETYLSMLIPAGEAGVKTHGFAMTNKEVFRHLPFYSVDSTSWIMGQQFGSTFVVEGQQMKIYGYDHKERIRSSPYFKDLCEKYHVSQEGFVSDDPYDTNKMCAAVWCEYQKVIDWQHRNDAIVIAAGEAPEIEKTELPAEIRTKDVHVEDMERLCDYCYIADKCPYMEKGATCKVEFKPTGELGPVEAAKLALNSAFERIQFAMAYEKQRGGLIDPQVSKDLAAFVAMAEKVKKMEREYASVTFTATATADSNASQGLGVISRIFGGYGKAGAKNPAERSEGVIEGAPSTPPGIPLQEHVTIEVEGEEVPVPVTRELETKDTLTQVLVIEDGDEDSSSD